MTNREFFTLISSNETLSDEIRSYADAAIAKLDSANEKRRNTPTKAQKESLPYLNFIMSEILSTDTPMTAADTAAVLTANFGETFTTQKASGFLRALVNRGDAIAIDVKAKKGTVKAYTKVVPAEAEEAETSETSEA